MDAILVSLVDLMLFAHCVIIINFVLQVNREQYLSSKITVSTRKILTAKCHCGISILPYSEIAARITQTVQSGKYLINTNA